MNYSDNNIAAPCEVRGSSLRLGYVRYPNNLCVRIKARMRVRKQRRLISVSGS